MVCPRCGEENPDRARFCFACGFAFDVATPREERKVVTVLFADLVGFTSRAETLDPEDVRALLTPYHQRLRSELERFGGTVEKFIGDAVVALFGAPVAHEDDPEREPVTAKGKSQAIPAWEPVQAKARFGMDLEQRSLTPLVVRESELGTLC